MSVTPPLQLCNAIWSPVSFPVRIHLSDHFMILVRQLIHNYPSSSLLPHTETSVFCSIYFMVITTSTRVRFLPLPVSFTPSRRDGNRWKTPQLNNDNINTDSHSFRQTGSGTRVNTADGVGGRRRWVGGCVLLVWGGGGHPLGNFLWSSAKRLTSWTCANEHEIIIEAARKCRWGMWKR